MSEHVIPTNCPECTALLAANYHNHCNTSWCGWVECGSCREVIDTRRGRHMHGRETRS